MAVAEPAARRQRSFWLVLIVAFIITVISAILSYGLYLFFIRPLTPLNPDYSNLFQLYNLLDSIIVFLFNPVTCFYLLYRISSWFSFDSNQDYLSFMAYAFVGGAVGFLVGYAAELEMASLAFGSAYVFPSIFDAISFSNLVLGSARAGLGALFVAFTGIVFGHIRSGSLLAAGKSEQNPAAPQQQQASEPS